MDAITEDNMLSAEEMEAALATLNTKERAYLRFLISRIVSCFVDDGKHALVLFSTDDGNQSSICSVNCEEIAAAHMLIHANELMGFACTRDAPAKEKFN
jgi:hypothetical protein